MPKVGKGATARSHRRRKAEENLQKHSAFIQKLMKKYDKSQSGNLEKSELQSMLKDLNDGTDPTPQEVEMILTTVDARDGDVNGAIDMHELETAMLVWKNYQENREYIDSVFDKFDVDKNGHLDLDQLKAFLHDLSDGEEVGDAEVQYVMDMTDKGAACGKDKRIDKSEVIRAASEWYACIGRKDLHQGEVLETKAESDTVAPVAGPASPLQSPGQANAPTTCLCSIL